MTRPLLFKRDRFPVEVIRYAVWLYFRVTLSLRDIEELLAQRGIYVSYETIRCWTTKFGPLIAATLRRRRPAPTGRWHLDEMAVKIDGPRMGLWRAVDDEGEVLDIQPAPQTLALCGVPALDPHDTQFQLEQRDGEQTAFKLKVEFAPITKVDCVP